MWTSLTQPVTFFMLCRLHVVPSQCGALSCADFAIGWTPSYAEFPHPATDILNVVAQTLAVFLFAAAMFNFVIQTSNIVLEKETKVREVSQGGMRLFVPQPDLSSLAARVCPVMEMRS